MPPLLRALVVLIVLGAVTSTSYAAPPLEPPRDIRSYVLFAYDEMILKGAVGAVDRGYVRGGNIGVNYPDRGQDGSPSLSFATLGPVIMDTGSSAVADSVRAANRQGVFFNLFANSVNASFDPTILGVGPVEFTTPIIAAANLPVLPFTPGRALTDTAADVLVGGSGFPSPHPLAPGAYRDVRVNDRKTLNLSDGVYDFRSFSVGTNVTVNVTDRTIIQIDRDWSVNDGLQFGVGTRAGARVHLGALGFPATGLPAVNFAHRSELHMQFFSPNGWMDMGGINQLHGRYWAQRITGDASNDVALQEPPPDGEPPGEGEDRRYQCYEIHRPTFDEEVPVVDQVGASTVTIKRAKRICAPADVDGRDPTAPLAAGHLTYYTLRQTTPFTPARATVTNEFGTIAVKLAKPDRLLVPTAKSLTHFPDPLAVPIDHFKCYRLSAARTRAEGLAVTDQFGSIEVAIKKPMHLCLAAAVNGEPVPDPDASLLCYLVRGTRAIGGPPIVYTRNQFGIDQYAFYGPRDLCVPSTVVFE